VRYFLCADCPVGFTYVASVNGCYKEVTLAMNWTDAGQYCRSLDGHLLVISHQQEQAAVAEMLGQICIFCYFSTDLGLLNMGYSWNFHFYWTFYFQGGLIVRQLGHCTCDGEVMGSTPGRVAIKCLVRGWVTFGGQVNHLGIQNSAFYPFREGKSSTGLSGWGCGRTRSSPGWPELKYYNTQTTIFV